MSGDLSRDELVEQGRAVLDWIAEYLENPEQYPVLSQVRPGDIRASLPTSPPHEAESIERILEDFE
jgi:aromatic-L-amino-acid decarboxylase